MDGVMKLKHLARIALVLQKSLTLHTDTSGYSSTLLKATSLVLFWLLRCLVTCVAGVSPLTAEEIAQRREALKQRLAEKKELASQDTVSASSDLSNGNIHLLFVEVIFEVA